MNGHADRVRDGDGGRGAAQRIWRGVRGAKGARLRIIRDISTMRVAEEGRGEEGHKRGGGGVMRDVER